MSIPSRFCNMFTKSHTRIHPELLVVGGIRETNKSLTDDISIIHSNSSLEEVGVLPTSDQVLAKDPCAKLYSRHKEPGSYEQYKQHLLKNTK